MRNNLCPMYMDFPEFTFEKLGRQFLYSEYFMHACSLEIKYKFLKIKSFSKCSRKMILLIFPLVFAVSSWRLFHHAFYDSFLNF